MLVTCVELSFVGVHNFSTQNIELMGKVGLQTNKFIAIIYSLLLHILIKYHFRKLDWTTNDLS